MKQRLTLALLLGATLLICGCGSRSVGNKIDDQFIPSNVSSNIEALTPTSAARVRTSS